MKLEIIIKAIKEAIKDMKKIILLVILVIYPLLSLLNIRITDDLSITDMSIEELLDFLI